MWSGKGQTVEDEFAEVVESGQVVNPCGNHVNPCGTFAVASLEVFVCRVALMNL